MSITTIARRKWNTSAISAGSVWRAAELARWTRNQNQFRQLVSDFYPAALRREPNFWPAHLDTALLFAEKYNTPDAAAELLARSRSIRMPRNRMRRARNLRCKASIWRRAKGSIERALQINPQLVWAHAIAGRRAVCRCSSRRSHRGSRQSRRLTRATKPRSAASPRLMRAIDGMPEWRTGRANAKADRQKSSRAIRIAANSILRWPKLATGCGVSRWRRIIIAKPTRRCRNSFPCRGKLGLTLMRLGEEAEAAQAAGRSVHDRSVQRAREEHAAKCSICSKTMPYSRPSISF